MKSLICSFNRYLDHVRESTLYTKSSTRTAMVDVCFRLQLLLLLVNYSNNFSLFTHAEKNRGADHFAAHGQLSGLPMEILPCKSGCPLLPYMETVDSAVGSSEGSPLLPKYEKVGSSVGSGVGCQWEFCHVNKVAHYFPIRIKWAG